MQFRMREGGVRGQGLANGEGIFACFEAFPDLWLHPLLGLPSPGDRGVAFAIGDRVPYAGGASNGHCDDS